MLMTFFIIFALLILPMCKIFEADEGIEYFIVILLSVVLSLILTGLTFLILDWLVPRKYMICEKILPTKSYINEANDKNNFSLLDECDSEIHVPFDKIEISKDPSLTNSTIRMIVLISIPQSNWIWRESITPSIINAKIYYGSPLFIISKNGLLLKYE